MKISELKKVLEQAENEVGDCEVFLTDRYSKYHVKWADLFNGEPHVQSGVYLRVGKRWGAELWGGKIEPVCEMITDGDEPKDEK
ncbi:MAG: hypothetical protein DRQ48_00975 [Gammaproteobacteria bacterium]|nr:MAG: hypothetical protein DRQ44_00395 [Gammaproteobacteria bacterium]RKZ72252.1 MAG: hypothetical protein DRQ48_00975 [Gammaproteobacteria bacterium]